MVVASKMVSIDWENFTPISASIGGTLIGTAAALMLYTTGRIAGISGIVGGLLRPTTSKERSWRGSFLGGLIGGGALTHLFLLDRPLPEISLDSISLVAAAILVGFGTRLGNGCTSGHGVCGLSRFSIRSLIATLTFMATGAMTATFSPGFSPISKLLISGGCVLPAALLLLQSKNKTPSASNKKNDDEVQKSEQYTMQTLSTGISGLLFGSGLAISGMTDPNKVASFLQFTSDSWDPSLMFVMGSAVVLGSLAFRFILPQTGTHSKMPLFGRKWYVPSRQDIDPRLIAGAALFGVGWGMAGMCPGPALVASPFSAKGILFAVTMLSSMTVFNMLSE